MRHRLGWRLLVATMCCLAVVLALVEPSLALTKIIIVPTARTIGARRYAIELNRKAPLLDEQARKLDVTMKIGLGERCMFEAKFPIQQNGSGSILLYGKYTFATANSGLTAAAIGIENVGAGSEATPYLTFSHFFKPVDVTVGVAKGVNSVERYLAGLDYHIGDSLHILTDYNSGTSDFASAGLQYQFAPHWGVKSGIEFPREGRANLMIKIIYDGRY